MTITTFTIGVIVLGILWAVASRRDVESQYQSVLVPVRVKERQK